MAAHAGRAVNNIGGAPTRKASNPIRPSSHPKRCMLHFFKLGIASGLPAAALTSDVHPRRRHSIHYFFGCVAGVLQQVICLFDFTPREAVMPHSRYCGATLAQDLQPLVDCLITSYARFYTCVHNLAQGLW